MSILRDFEKRLEGAVEGFFARAFRSGLQPVELAKALQRYADSYQQVGVDGVFVPNVYRFTLSPADLERFSGFTRSLQRELADVARRTADEKGWRTHGPIRIEFERNPATRVGTYELRGKMESARQPARSRQAAAAPAGPAAATRPYAAETLRAPEPAPDRHLLPARSATLRVVAGPDVGSSWQLKDRATIGRLPECEVTVTDASVSRRHARIQREGDRWTVTDLGSTNGVVLNGTPIAGTAELSPGDRLELGGIVFVFADG